MSGKNECFVNLCKMKKYYEEVLTFKSSNDN